MTTKAATAEGAAARVADQLRPYSPSWVDQIMALLRRAPGPTWLAYAVMLAASLGLASLEGLISTAAAIEPLDLFYGLLFVTPLAVLHYLDQVAGEAWDAFRQATSLDEAAAAGVRYELTVSPARTGWVILVLGYAANTLWYMADPIGIGIYGQPPAYVAMRVVIEGYLGGVLFMLVYQTIRQLVIIDRLHEAATNIDLFRPRAVQAMSRLTARSAIGIVLLAVLTGLAPGSSEQSWLATLVVFVVPMLALAVATFFLPIRRLHDRLVEEKARLLSAAVPRLHAAIDTLHQLVDAEVANPGDAERSREAQTRIDALSKAQAALLQERELIGRLSTWPWEPSTFRAVASAVALPVALFLITRLLERLVF